MVARPGKARGLTAAAALLVSLAASGCFRFGYERVLRFRAPEERAIESLRTGASLADCLRELGAPWRVLEREGGGETILVWAWERSSGWKARVSSGDRSTPGSFEVADSRAGWQSLVLWFDDDDRLLHWKQGHLPAALASRL